MFDWYQPENDDFCLSLTGTRQKSTIFRQGLVKHPKMFDLVPGKLPRIFDWVLVKHPKMFGWDLVKHLKMSGWDQIKHLKIFAWFSVKNQGLH